MQSYCLMCKKNTENKNTSVVRSKNNRLRMTSDCAVCGNKKSKFNKKQDSKGLLSNLGLNIPFLKTLI